MDRERGTPADAKASPTCVDYRKLFENAADAVLVTDAEGRYVDANPRACEPKTSRE